MKVDLIQALADATDDVRKAAASGATTSDFVPAGNYSSPVRSEWDGARAVRDGYKSCSWVYACLDRLVGACSSVPWRVMERKGRRGIGKGEWSPVDGHPLEIAIEYPNDILSRQFLMAAGVLHLGTGGNALWKSVTVSRAGGKVPAEFWPMNPDVWRPVPHETDWIAGYRRSDRPYEGMLKVPQVIHTQFPDPSNLLWGQSPMRAIARVIDMDVEHVAWNRALPRNRMTPETAVIFNDLRSPSQLDEAADRLAERYAGPELARRPLVLGAGAEVVKMGLTPSEMDWIESRHFTLIEICAAFGLIPSLFVPDAKYSNQDIAVKYMWENGAMRFLSAFEDAFNTRLIPREQRRSMWIHFDTSGVPAMSESLEKRLEAHERAVRSAIPPNQSFVILDIPCPPVEGGDKPLVVGTLVPLEQVVAEPPEPDPVDPTDGAVGAQGQGAQDQGPGAGSGSSAGDATEGQDGPAGQAN